MAATATATAATADRHHRQKVLAAKPARNG